MSNRLGPSVPLGNDTQATRSIPLTSPRAEYALLKSAIDDAVHQVLARGDFVLGDDCEAFETEFATYCGTSFGIGLGSGSDAILLALKACDIEPGAEVLVPANVCFSCCSPIVHAGARPVFVDIDPATLQMSPPDAERCVTARTRAILAVHFFGHPADMPALLAIARRYNLRVIEDCALAVGAEVVGRRVGSFGDAAAFSFHPVKPLGALGDAGMVTTSDRGIAERVRQLARYGAAHRPATPETLGFSSHEAQYPLHGYNSKIDTLQAAVLRVKLRHLSQLLSHRTQIAERYTSTLQHLPIDLPNSVGPIKRQYSHYVISLTERNAARAYLRAHRVAASVPYFPLVPFQPAYRSWGHRTGDFPVAERVGSRLLALPLGLHLSDEHVDFVAGLLARFMDADRKRGEGATEAPQAAVESR